jgi:hypothetical protein
METQSPRVMGVKNKDINKTNSQHRSLTASPSRSFPAAVLSLTAQQFILHYPDGRKLKRRYNCLTNEIKEIIYSFNKCNK